MLGSITRKELFYWTSIYQAHKLGAMGFNGSMDLTKALSCLIDLEKILDEVMRYLSKNKVKIASFKLEGDAKK